MSTWLIPTTHGLIMIDSSQEPYVDHVLDNIRNLGFDPKDIKYILIVHGHLDHFGGAARIKELSGARVGVDGGRLEDGGRRSARSSASVPQALAPINRIVQRDARDLVLKDGDVVTLGKTSLKVYVTPGHTPGSASFEFTVYDNGKPYKAFMFGGPEPRDGVEGGKKFRRQREPRHADGAGRAGRPAHSQLARRCRRIPTAARSSGWSSCSRASRASRIRSSIPRRGSSGSIA